MTVRIILFLLSLISMQFGKAQTTVSLSPIDDTELNQAGGPVPLGAQINLLIRPWTPSFSSRSAIKFDLSAYGGENICSAFLVLSERSTLGSSRIINVHRLTTSWNQNTAHLIRRIGLH